MGARDFAETQDRRRRQPDRPLPDAKRSQQAGRRQLLYANPVFAANAPPGAASCPVRLAMFVRSLSARLLVLTIFFVMLSEVLIFVPSVARFRMTWLDNHIASGHLAALALAASPDGKLDPALTAELLRHVGAHAVILHKPDGEVRMLDAPMPPKPDVTFDLTKGNVPIWIQRSLETLFSTGNRIMRVIAPSPMQPQAIVEVLLDEAPLRQELWGFGVRILQLSILISLTTAALVYLSLHWMLVRPMRRITDNMIAFRDDPEDASRRIAPTGRR